MRRSIAVLFSLALVLVMPSSAEAICNPNRSPVASSYSYGAESTDFVSNMDFLSAEIDTTVPWVKSGYESNARLILSTGQGQQWASVGIYWTNGDEPEDAVIKFAASSGYLGAPSPKAIITVGQLDGPHNQIVLSLTSPMQDSAERFIVKANGDVIFDEEYFSGPEGLTKATAVSTINNAASQVPGEAGNHHNFDQVKYSFWHSSTTSQAAFLNIIDPNSYGQVAKSSGHVDTRDSSGPCS